MARAQNPETRARLPTRRNTGASCTASTSSRHTQPRAACACRSPLESANALCRRARRARRGHGRRAARAPRHHPKRTNGRADTPAQALPASARPAAGPARNERTQPCRGEERGKMRCRSAAEAQAPQLPFPSRPRRLECLCLPRRPPRPPQPTAPPQTHPHRFSSPTPRAAAAWRAARRAAEEKQAESARRTPRHAAPRRAAPRTHPGRRRPQRRSWREPPPAPTSPAPPAARSSARARSTPSGCQSVKVCLKLDRRVPPALWSLDATVMSCRPRLKHGPNCSHAIVVRILRLVHRRMYQTAAELAGPEGQIHKYSMG